MTSKAIFFSRTGGPEVLEFADADQKTPGAGEVLVRHTAIGVNFIDTYHRTGLYPLPLPSRLGLEAAGIVEAVGAGVTDFKPGDRAGYCNGPIGAYAAFNVIPAEKLIRLPDGVSDESAAAGLLKGLTAQMLLKRLLRPVQSGDAILLHAASGGVGLIMSQWAKRLGVNVIGVVGSEEKAKLARENGCTHVILGRSENIATRVKEITGGKGVPIVYDSVGKDTFTASLDSLAPRGLLVSFGNASGPAPLIDVLDLNRRGALSITRPSLGYYVSTKAELDAAAADFFSLLADGSVTLRIGQRFALKDAADAHRALESRATSGSTILIP